MLSFLDIVASDTLVPVLCLTIRVLSFPCVLCDCLADGRLTSIGAANSVQSVTSPPMRHTADVTTAYHTGEGVPYGTNNPSPGIYLPVEADTAAAFSAERDRCNEGILDVASTTTAGSQSQPYPRTDSSMLHLFDHVTFDLNGVQCTGSLLYLGRPTSAIKYDIAGIELVRSVLKQTICMADVTRRRQAALCSVWLQQKLAFGQKDFNLIFNIVH